MIIGGLLCFFMLRRKRRRQQNYNGGAWKESSFKSRDAAFKNAPSGGFKLPSFGFLKNSQDRPDIKVIRPSIDKEREPYGTGYSQPYPPFGSTFNSMPMNTMDSNTSPPGTSVPLFAQPIGIQQPPVAIQPSVQIHPYNQPSLQNPAPSSRKPWAPPSTRVLTQMTRRQPDEADELETTPLMEAPPADIPPGYTSRSWHEQNDLVQSLGVRLESGGRYSASPPYERTFESEQVNYANQQQGQGFMRNPQAASTTVTSSYSTAQSEKAIFHKPSISTFTTATTDTRSDAWTRPSLATPSLDSRSTSSDAPLTKARPVIPPTPSAPIPSNFPSTATTGVSTQQSMKRMKGPRTRGESLYADSQRRMPAVPMTAIPPDDEGEVMDPFRSVSPESGYLSDKRMGQTQLDAWNKLGGVKVPMNRVRGYGEDPESPVDPGVNMGRARQI
ncbi:hypothetical protein CPB86DRAFT_562143 [Serendipita vermifera]|nr:hypothetical protein CPB86DRAFT_562143 [Serendipita vermifera]